MGWEELQNGELLETCEENEFDVLVTHDESMRHQQNIARYDLTVQLDAPSNDA